MLASWFTSATLAATVFAGTIVWDGRFNDITTAADLAKWDWSNQVGPYQYYIHGSAPISKYVNLSPTFKNPADAASKQGVRITIDGTSSWNGQQMMRTELIPQTKAAINRGRMVYHFSVKRSGVNAPVTTTEHQVNFFESHFTELKYGLIAGAPGTSDPALRWYANSQSQWSAPLEPDVWHNVAYEIDFDGGSVTFWHSTGAAPLAKTAGPVKVSASSNGQDWHLGVLRLPKGGVAGAEDWYFSGVYVESGAVTTAASGPGGA
ncbi:hypothetical protein LTS18_006064 [Coniosporium uncinatum]|uniref:Uncharacterized protein n=1 Tax=Coniosporium uncinatum TaxID=93489 RepID=A0ACC3DXC5_9PEZI|nr:hypothetical protein LTS18_006064 [Coniosporium uncinatum]